LQKSVILGLALASATLTGCVETETTYVAASIDRTVTVVNNSGLTISRFYGSNSGRSSWEEDILGNGVIPAGASVDINFNDGSGACLFDFKAVFADGSSATETNVDVCRISVVTVS
jgi:hypothetical protein